ncbi:MAG: phosphatase PAP2 family protein, partial [Anaerolineales bacterium]|nr:phosphatase PAP2 family protein [Anaerolineales bacterium]
MDTILNSGINWIVALQNLGDWLALPMKAFSFLGTEEFFMLILPALYWSIDAGLGLRVGVILLLSSGVNHALKLAFHGPRPYWFSQQVSALAVETSFGVPSGHAQTAAGVWGMLASGIKKRWAWLAAALIIFLIGLSRLYLAVHFPHDVILGWLFGGLLLWLTLRFWEAAAAWLDKCTLGQKILLAFAASLFMILLSLPGLLWLQANWQIPAIWLQNAARAFPEGELPAPVALSGAITPAATLFGLLAGLAWFNRRGGFSTAGPAWKRILRYVIGLVGVLVFSIGLKMLFGIFVPDGEAL